MTTIDSFEIALESKHARRIANEDKFHERISKLEAKAGAMIGELVRNGEVIHYIWPQGGRYREGCRSDLLSFLVRNKYVR